jgi:hypothetical protein
MSLRFLTFGALLAGSFASHAMRHPYRPIFANNAVNETKEVTLKLPNAESLIKGLTSIGMEHFVNGSELVWQLANKDKTPQDLAQTINIAIELYYGHLEAVEDREHATHMRANWCKIFKVVLADHPEAFEALAKEKFHTPCGEDIL